VLSEQQPQVLFAQQSQVLIPVIVIHSAPLEKMVVKTGVLIRWVVLHLKPHTTSKVYNVAKHHKNDIIKEDLINVTMICTIFVNSKTDKKTYPYLIFKFWFFQLKFYLLIVTDAANKNRYASLKYL